MRILALVVCILAGVVAACSAEGAQSQIGTPTAVPDSTERAPQLESARPVDGSLAAVSMSSLTPGAKEALELCGLLDYPAFVGGMAEIPRASEATKWVTLYGTERELRSDAPAWLISVAGEINLRGQVFIEPTCFVLNHEAAWISSGAKRSASGDVVYSKLVPRDPPTMRLPPLEP